MPKVILRSLANLFFFCIQLTSDKLELSKTNCYCYVCYFKTWLKQYNSTSVLLRPIWYRKLASHAWLLNVRAIKPISQRLPSFCQFLLGIPYLTLVQLFVCLKFFWIKNLICYSSCHNTCSFSHKVCLSLPMNIPSIGRMCLKKNCSQFLENQREITSGNPEIILK